MQQGGAGIEGPIEIYNFPGQVLEEAGVDRPVPPFAVVCSKDMGPPGYFWPTRRYQWGDVECANYEHSDFQLLKCVPATQHLKLEPALSNCWARVEMRIAAFGEGADVHVAHAGSNVWPWLQLVRQVDQSWLSCCMPGLVPCRSSALCSMQSKVQASLTSRDASVKQGCGQCLSEGMRFASQHVGTRWHCKVHEMFVQLYFCTAE